MTPSTKAAAGAFLISSLMPQAWRTMRSSKSRYFSKINRASSISLPELSTAKAHLRNKGYRPPWPESSSLAISCWERCSRLPFGATRASTMSDDRIEASTQHPFLGIDIDRNVVLRAHPHFDHVGVRESYAAIGPVVGLIIRRRMVRRVGETVNHDGAARRPTLLVGSKLVFPVRVGDLDCQKEVAAGMAAPQEIMAFRRSEIPLPLLVSDGAQAESHLVGAHQMTAVIQVEFVFRFMDHDPVGQIFGSVGDSRPKRYQRRHHQTLAEYWRRKSA